MGPRHEYVFGLGVCVREMWGQTLQPSKDEWWCSLPHGREQEPPLGSTNQGRIPPLSQMSQHSYKETQSVKSLFPNKCQHYLLKCCNKGGKMQHYVGQNVFSYVESTSQLKFLTSNSRKECWKGHWGCFMG